jgi:hypothetical protein
MKPHLVREMVNELRDVAVIYSDTHQLRDRIAHVVHKYLAEPQSDLAMVGMLFEENQRLLCEISQAEKQKPVAWMTNSEQETTAEYLFSNMQTPIHDIPLYTAPPQREWVGLTDADIAQAMHGSVEGSNMLPYQFARAIEAKLRSKNEY